MNEFEKSIYELINMLVQYDATTHKSEPALLVGEASTSKAKGKGARRWKRKKGKGMTVKATASNGGAPAAPTGKGKGKVGGSQRSKVNGVCMHCQGKGHWKREFPQLLSNPSTFAVEVNMISNSSSCVLDTGCGAHICNNLQVLKRSRKLNKDEMVLRLGDGRLLPAEAVGSLSLVVSNHVKIDLKDCYFVPNVCGPLSIPARGGSSYFITFTDDHSRYGYVYLIRYKSEAFGRFKEYRLEVENQTNRKKKALRSDRGGEYLSELPPSFWGYALETAAKLLNIAPSRTVSPDAIRRYRMASLRPTSTEMWGRPAYVKRLVGDKLDSRSSLYRFIGYPKKTGGYYFYDTAKQKVFISRNAVFLKKGIPSDNRRDEVLIEESSEEPHGDSTTSFEPSVHTDGVPVLHRSTRESRAPESLELTGRLRPSRLGSWRRDTLNDLGSALRKTYSPVVIAKSIQILLAITAWYDYEIWQMDVKTAFLNDFIEEEKVEEEQNVCRLQKSIYGLSKLPKVNGSSVAYLVLYVDDILLIGNNVKMLGDIKAWLSTQFSMKDMGDASYILVIKIYRDRSKRMLGLTQSPY
ncbi:UNVERIFIED_CONTAM: hypothetical protein Slati_1449000 [Sesamum latifolium]|uniref:Integrase catalytic domain-containing protein n=1 Tax=Sesamum latifolium TaxID=2727402 RepID=A0AAW2X5Q8_9LAMI